MTVRTAALTVMAFVAIVIAVIVPRIGPVRASGVAAVDGGSGHSCALTAAGGLTCWGFSSRGRLGDGTDTGQLAVPPVDVVGLTSDVATFAASDIHTCAVTTTGAVKCWGWNYYGQLGDGTKMDRLVPVDVSGLDSGIKSIAAGSSHTCVVTTTGGVKCWGWNPDGLLGFLDDSMNDRSTEPGDVGGLSSGVDAVAAGGRFNCALATSGGVKCWGINTFGQLGDGTTTARTAPVAVVGLTNGVRAITTGHNHACALTDAGGVKCWGSSQNGRLGVLPGPECGVQLFCSTTPLTVEGLGSGVAAIAAGDEHTCALMDGGGLKCWGENANGQLGDGSTTDRGTPVDVAGLSDVISVGAGIHTCAVQTSGAVLCWGYNQVGQLGDGTTVDQYTPVEVIGLGPKPESTPTPLPPLPSSAVVAIDSLSMSVGDTGSVALNVFDFPEPGLGGWTIDVSFDPLILDAVSCHPELGGVCNTGFTVSSVRTTGATSEPPPVGDVLLGSITFACSSEGVSPLEISIVVLATEPPQPIEAGTVEGEIVCTGLALVGDTNCDGTVNPLDATLILQLAAGLIPALPCPEGGDANLDGMTNPLDAALVLQFSAALIGSLPA